MVEKDGRREGDKGTVSSSDTCFSVYHLQGGPIQSFQLSIPRFIFVTIRNNGSKVVKRLLHPLGAVYIYIVAKIYGSIRSRNKSCRCEHHSFLHKLPFLRTDWNRQVFQQTTKQAFPEYMEPIKISVNSQTTVTLEMKSNSVDKYLLSSLPMIYQWNIILLDEKFKRNKIDIDRGGRNCYYLIKFSRDRNSFFSFFNSTTFYLYIYI